MRATTIAQSPAAAFDSSKELVDQSYALCVDAQLTLSGCSVDALWTPLPPRPPPKTSYYALRRFMNGR